MGEKLVKMLNCEEKEEGYQDSDSEISDPSPKSMPQAANPTPLDPPFPTLKDPPPTQAIQNTSQIEPLATPKTLNEGVSFKKHSLLDISGFNEANNEGLKSLKPEIEGKDQKIAENEEKEPKIGEKAVKNDEKQPKIDVFAEERVLKPPEYVDFSRNDGDLMQGSMSRDLYLPNQVMPEEKKLFSQENSGGGDKDKLQENDEDFQMKYSAVRMKGKAFSNPEEGDKDNLFRKVPGKLANELG